MGLGARPFLIIKSLKDILAEIVDFTRRLGWGRGTIIHKWEQDLGRPLLSQGDQRGDKK